MKKLYAYSFIFLFLSHAAQAELNPATLVRSEAARAPNSADDTARGYAAGNLWKDPSGMVWQNISAARGAAAWSPVATQYGLPCDLVAGGCYGAYGAIRLDKDYTGPAFKVRTAAGAELDVGFSGNEPDWAASDIFCQGNGCEYSMLYDQSGNGRDCVPQNAASRMPYAIPGGAGAPRAILFNGNYRQQQGASYGASCSLPTASLSSRSASVLFIGRPHQTGSIATMAHAGGANATQMNFYFANSLFNFVHPAGGSLFPSGTVGRIPLTAQLFGFSSGAAGMQFYFDEQAVSTTPPAATTWTNLTLGSNADSEPATTTAGRNFLSADLWGMLVFDRQVTTAEAGEIRKFAVSRLPVLPQLRQAIVLTGDSNVAGWGAETGVTYPLMLAAMLPRPVKLFNTAIGGVTCASMANEAGHPEVKASAVQGYNQLIIIGCGTNDLYTAGATPEAAYASLQNLIADIRSVNSGAPILVETSIDRTNGARNTERLAFNELIRAGIAAANGGTGTGVSIGSGPVYLTDLGGPGTVLGDAGDSASQTYFQTDQTHLKAAGMHIKAGAHFRVIEQYGLLQ